MIWTRELLRFFKIYRKFCNFNSLLNSIGPWAPCFVEAKARKALLWRAPVQYILWQWREKEGEVYFCHTVLYTKYFLSLLKIIRSFSIGWCTECSCWSSLLTIKLNRTPFHAWLPSAIWRLPWQVRKYSGE